MGVVPVKYTDPTGNCVFFGVDTLICLGAGIGFIANVFFIQTLDNMEAGMPFLEAIYHENIDWTSVVASTTAGGISGVFVPLIPVSTSFGGALVYGALDGFLWGLVEQGVINLLRPCRDWYEDLLLTGASSAFAGALTAGTFKLGGRFVSGLFHSLGLDPSRIRIPGPRNSPYGKLDFLLGEVPTNPKSIERGGFFKQIMGFSDETLDEACVIRPMAISDSG